MSDIFLSYAREDRAAVAKLAAALEKRGFTVWWDRNLRGGQQFSREIEKQLDGAGVVLVIWTSASVKSGWVEAEASHAKEREVLIPVLLEAVMPSVPLAFRLLETEDLTGWKGDDANDAFLKLVDDVAYQLGKSGDEVRPDPDPRRPMLHRGDLVVLALIAAMGVATSLLRGGSWSVGERWLWPSAFVLMGMAWLAGRLHLRVWRTASHHGWRFGALAPPALVLAAGAFWVVSAFRIYELPVLAEGVQGVYVARLQGDRADRYRDGIVASLNQLIEDKRLDGVRAVALPRVIGDSAQARLAGERGGARLVFWGTVRPGGSSVPLEGRVTFVGIPSMFTPSQGMHGSNAVLASELSGIELQGEFAAMQRSLVLFLVANGLYHAGDALSARDYIAGALAELEHAQQHDPSLATILASLHFYQGNIHFRMDQADSALSHFREAVSHSLHPVEAERRPQYIEALNNLALLLLRRGEFNAAAEQLERSDRECAGGSRVNPVCAYAWYNLATAYNEMGRHEDALQRLRRVSDMLQPSLAAHSPDSVGRILLAYTYRGMAYSESMLAARVERKDERAARYLDALGNWERATAILPGTAPGTFWITLGRIHLGLASYDSALAALRRAESEAADRPEVHLLLAAAHICMKREERVTAINTYLGRVGVAEATAGLEQLAALTAHCSAGS